MVSRWLQVGRKLGWGNLLILVRSRCGIVIMRLYVRKSSPCGLMCSRWETMNGWCLFMSCFLMKRRRLMTWLWRLVVTLNVLILVKRCVGRTRLACTVMIRSRRLMTRMYVNLCLMARRGLRSRCRKRCHTRWPLYTPKVS